MKKSICFALSVCLFPQTLLSDDSPYSLGACELSSLPDDINKVSYYDYMRYAIDQKDLHGDEARYVFDGLRPTRAIYDLNGDFIYELRTELLSHRVLPYKPAAPYHVKDVYLTHSLECESSVLNGFTCRQFCKVGQKQDMNVPD